MIDPDGFIFDVTQGWGHTVEGVTVTCMMSYPQWGGWVPWSAHLYEDQVNPQVTDDSYPDGVLTPGYFAFFTPPGHYYLQVEGIEGYQSWRSPVVEVITQIVHVNVPYTPWSEDDVYAVTLTPEGLEPAVITIPVGSSVEWVSALSGTAIITDLMRFSENPLLRPSSALDPISDTRGWDAGMLEPGRVYRREFSTPGAYPYTDGAGHNGTVIVEGGVSLYLPLVLRQ